MPPHPGHKAPERRRGEQAGRGEQASWREGGRVNPSKGNSTGFGDMPDGAALEDRWTVEGRGEEGVHPCPQGSLPSWGCGSPGCRHGAAGTGSDVQTDMGVEPQLHPQSEGSGGLRSSVVSFQLSLADVQNGNFLFSLPVTL